MGVIVLGMHRSGTSAMTRVIDILGAAVGSPPMPARDDNPAGFWEVEALMQLNDALLLRLGGSWDAPPLPAPGWERADAIVDLRSGARDWFEAAHPSEPWVWKDPRACVLLPFWLDVLGRGHVTVVGLRDPVAIARSLAVRNDLPVELSLAIWERSMRGVLRDAAGLPALVVGYDDLLDRSAVTVAGIAAWLDQHGIAITGTAEEAIGSLQGDLRHTRASAARVRLPPEASPEQHELLACLDGLVGAHDALPRLEIPAETPWVPAVIDARRATFG